MDLPLTKSMSALRCFQRAVEIDDSNSKLWIEYGTLAYQLHSHASRQLKWVPVSSLHTLICIRVRSLDIVKSNTLLVFRMWRTMILVSLNISELPITLANRSVICQTEWHVFFNKWIRLYIKVLDYKCSSFLYFYSKCCNCLSVNFWTQISSNKYIKIDIFFKYLINVGV